MELIHDWRDIARRAWSFRLAGLAGVLSGAEVVVPLFAEDLQRGVFAVLSMMIAAAAMVARVIAQRDMP